MQNKDTKRLMVCEALCHPVILIIYVIWLSGHLVICHWSSHRLVISSIHQPVIMLSCQSLTLSYTVIWSSCNSDIQPVVLTSIYQHMLQTDLHTTIGVAGLFRRQKYRDDPKTGQSKVYLNNGMRG